MNLKLPRRRWRCSSARRSSIASLSFHVDAYHVSMRRDSKDSVCEATIKVSVGNQRAQTVSDGDGPVNALDGAMRLALVKFFPQLENVTLTDYKVRILDTATGTAAKTRVLIAVQRRQTRMGHRRREREHHRSQPAGARGQHGIRAC